MKRPAPENTGLENRAIIAPPIVHEVLGSPGQLLETEKRAFAEPRFGRDFTHIPVHAKLTIANPGDRFEQEADRIADQAIQLAKPKATSEMFLPHGSKDHLSRQPSLNVLEEWRGGSDDQIPIMSKALRGSSCGRLPAVKEKMIVRKRHRLWLKDAALGNTDRTYFRS